MKPTQKPAPYRPAGGKADKPTTLPVQAPMPLPADAPDAPWVETRRRPIDEAPKDSTKVRLFNGEITHGVPAYWRKSRNLVNRQWRNIEFWACPLTNRSVSKSWDHEMNREVTIKWLEWEFY